MARLPKIRKVLAYHLSRPVVNLLSRTPITPNTITWAGFFLSLTAATLIITNNLIAAGITVLIAGFFDILDGALARLTNQTTRFGTILDSILDRVSEAALLLGILALFLLSPESSLFFKLIPKQWSIGLVNLALLASLLVSYIRARAETQGLECQVGIFTRNERMITLTLGLLLSQFESALSIALVIIAVFSLFTAGQRLHYVRKQTLDDQPRRKN